MLTRIFTGEEVDAINSIPISQTNQPDVQIWQGTNTGMFSMKSAYHLAKEMEMRGNLEGSDKIKESILWKTIWKLNIPNAIKDFLWRACHNLLPTKENLFRQKVVNEPLCPICEKELETVFHVFWGCPAAMDVWGSSKRMFQKCSIVGGSFMQTAENVFSRSSVEKFRLFVQLVRRLWFRRNKWVHEGVFTNPNIIIRKTEELAEEFKKINKQVLTSGVVENTEGGKKWIVPPHGWHKVNFFF